MTVAIGVLARSPTPGDVSSTGSISTPAISPAEAAASPVSRINVFPSG
ncbi:hypothetical protein [Leifsonia xyli]|nr:hypothetical protein [Leifsonia xyli]